MFVASAAVAAMILRVSWSYPAAAAGAVTALAVLWAARWFSRRKLRKLLRSGDLGAVLARYQEALARIPHPDTMLPLMRATAYAAHGCVDSARAALASAARGPAWEAALEHRLFLDVLLLTFEGDREGALERAARISTLPLPEVEGVRRGRIVRLRDAVLALARAFAHSAEPGDRARLLEASEASPLVHWVMRYGAAVVAIDEGDLGEASALLEGAPAWPPESAFRAFHDELASRVGAAATA